MTVGDVITSILDFYHTHPYISYGGLDAVQESSDSFEFTVYAGILGIPENFMVLGSDPEKDSLIFHRAEWLPENMETSNVTVPIWLIPAKAPVSIF